MNKLPENTALHSPAPEVSANGSPFPSQSTHQQESHSGPRKLPAQRSRGLGRPLVLIVLFIFLLVGLDFGAHFLFGKSLVMDYAFGPKSGERADVILYIVKKEKLDVTVTEKGQLESADNKDVVCKVRAGNKGGGSGYATSITWVIDDGTRVRPGQLIMILDDSALKDQEDTQSVIAQQAYAAKVKAEKDYEIQLKKNETAIGTAEANTIIKEIALDKLTGLGLDQNSRGLASVIGIPLALTEGGSYQQQLDKLTGDVSLEQSNVEQNRERAAWAERMVKLSYMSPAQAQAEKSRLDSSVENLRNLQAQKRLLISHDRIQQLTTLTSDRDNAKLALVQAKLEAEATEIQFRILKQTATNVYDKEQAKLEDIQRQRAECRIYAPDDIEDGSMVVYFKNDSNRFRSTTEGLIEQGAQVKEGQKMLRIPNLSRMQVNTKIHEAMVGRVKGDVRVPTRLTEFMQIGMVTNTSLLGRTLATREDIMEKVRDYLRHKDPQFEYKKVADGQHATIRVESILGKQFVGHVRSIAAVASQADFFSSDVKLFQTYVLIGGELDPDGKVHPLEGEHLKPDMTAEVTIHVEGTPTPVLTVPIQAVIGGAEMGGTREVFVKTPTGYDRRPVTLGLYNDRMVEVSTGLSEGDEVVVNPKVLLGDDKTKTRENGDTKGGKNRKGGEGAPGGGDPGKGGWKGGKGKGKGGFGGPPPVS